MGMFDEVAFKCPKCGEIFFEQTKAGPYELKTFNASHIRSSIAESMGGDKIHCTECNTGFIVKPLEIKYTKLILLDESESGEDEYDY